jgi:hypothetical protein
MLIELMIAMILLSVGLLGLASLTVAVMRYEELASNRNEMVLLADSKLEELRAAARTRSADTLQLVIGGSLTAPAAMHADTVISGHSVRFVRLWQVEAGPANSRLVNMRISALRQDGRSPKFIDFTTLILIL